MDTLFPIVGIGASAGGLEALQEFVAAIPNDSGIAYVVVQHLAPDHPSIMDKLLTAHARIAVRRIEDGDRVAPDTIYVIPPGPFLEIIDGRFSLFEHDPETGVRTPIDRFFVSLAEACGSDAFGIVLSGTGSDGTMGVRAIKVAGGVTLVQESASARFPGMPDSAAATGLVDFTMRPRDMPGRILDITRHRHRLDKDDDEASGQFRSIESRLPDLLNSADPKDEHAFADYKPPTLVRRIQRRMSLLRQSSVDGYIRTLDTDPEERATLIRDFMIGVTEFFRDPETYETALEVAISNIVGSEADALRLWVPGCSTGEEAYSLAILFLEEMERQNRTRPLQVFGTDIDMHALRHARLGLFTASSLKNVSPARLARHFRKENGAWGVSTALREMCVFAPHNLLKDPPFSRLDMVSCRNVMIYLTGDAQKTVLPKFHYALKSGGYLLLGSSESLGRNEDLFKTIDRQAKLFQRNDGATTRFTALDARPTTRTAARMPMLDWAAGPTDDDRPALSMEARAERAFLQSQAATFAVVDRRGKLSYLSDAMARFVRPTGGLPDTTIDAYLTRALRLPVHAALAESRETGATAEVQNVVVDIDGVTRLIDVVATPLLEEDGASLIVLHEVRHREGADITPHIDQAASAEVIRRELALANRRLETMEREYENASQESQSANEELLSMNEELQSANEELETSREELQSINEELETINSELSENNQQLTRANSDLKNFLESTNIATLFLDADLRVRLFTPRLADLYGVLERDLGRDISDLAARVEYPELAEDCRHVTASLREVEREVRVPATEQVFQVHVRPYRTVDDRLDGTVLTFVDVTARRRNEEQLRRNARILREQYSELETLYDSTPVGLSLMDTELRWLRINRTLAEINGFPVEAHIGKKQEDLIPGVGEQVAIAMRKVLETGEPILGLEVRGETPKEPGVEREWLVDYYPVKDGETVFAVGTCVQEITEQRKLERLAASAAAKAEESRAQLRRLFDAAPAFVAMHEGPGHVFVYSNPRHHEVSGGRPLIGRPVADAFPELDGTGIFAAFDQVYRTGKPVTQPEFEATLTPPDGGKPVTRSYSQVLQPWFTDDGSVGGVMSFAFDITDQVRARAALEESEARMARLFDHAPAVISIFEGPEQRYIYVNPRHDAAVGRGDLIGKPLREAMPELQGQGIIETFERVYATGQPYLQDELPVRIDGPDGRVTYYQQIIQPWYHDDGSIGGTMSFNTDITEQVEARKAAQVATDRLTSIQNSLASFVGLLAPDGTLLEANESAVAATGVPPDELIGRKFWECYWWSYDPGMQDRLQGWVERAATGESIKQECDVRVQDGGREQLITIDFRLIPTIDDTGKVIEIVPSGIDVTAWRSAERRKDVLLAELQHRVKNILATVQAITRFSARHADTRDALVASLTQRLAAISRTHDVLTRTDWGNQSLFDIIRAEVLAYIPEQDARLRLEGPDVSIDPNRALTLSLAIHELVTNAAKYGALSTDTGSLRVEVDQRDDGSTSVIWREEGGPKVIAPTRRGFGSFLLEQIVPNDLEASVVLTYQEDGVICEFILSAPNEPQGAPAS